MVRLPFGLASQWWQDPNYTHGFFVPVFSLFLLWERRAKLAALRIQPAWSGLVILLFALMALVLGTINSGFFLYRISLLLFIAGLVVFLAGWKHLAAISFPLAFLVLMIPSSTLLEQITFPLQIIASKTASFLLMLAGVPAVREGNIILLPSARLEVAEACSGIRSLFSLITLTVVYGYMAETKIRVRVLLALMAVPVSVLANALRIAVTGLVVEYWGIEGAAGHASPAFGMAYLCRLPGADFSASPAVPGAVSQPRRNAQCGRSTHDLLERSIRDCHVAAGRDRAVPAGPRPQ